MRMAGILIYSIENELPQVSSYITKLYNFIYVLNDLFLLLSKGERKNTPAIKRHALSSPILYL